MGLGLCCENTGQMSTCVRSTGESVVDVTWSSPGASRSLSNWRVLQEETMSDHLYITMRVGLTKSQALRNMIKEQRWVAKKMNNDLFEAALLARTWPTGGQQPQSLGDLEDEACKIQQMMVEACDVAMPRATPEKTNGILVEETDQEKLDQKIREYRSAKKTLRIAIHKAKEQSWKNLTESLNEDPWSTAYRVVLNKLRPSTVPYSESMEPPFLKETLNTLFPASVRSSREWK
ncbi:PREDICTED: uncharacterized protein LOC108757965 [Trachymyrmex cornetzi]|uniref:uncharacterized protein LOC108757965 n=1 Tax=Trachymyrmex cornetzi TaxID=471704 RepID=UPI00084F74C9|nr:PREDICTED: uncharacterized protein LOC108757965 [Trachymyrmex cornetzi]